MLPVKQARDASRRKGHKNDRTLHNNDKTRAVFRCTHCHRATMVLPDGRPMGAGLDPCPGPWPRAIPEWQRADEALNACNIG